MSSIRQKEHEAASVMASLSPAELGDRLRRARVRQGRSLPDLAEAAVLTKRTIGGTHLNASH